MNDLSWWWNNRFHLLKADIRQGRQHPSGHQSQVWWQVYLARVKIFTFWIIVFFHKAPVSTDHLAENLYPINARIVPHLAHLLHFHQGFQYNAGIKTPFVPAFLSSSPFPALGITVSSFVMLIQLPHCGSALPTALVLSFPDLCFTVSITVAPWSVNTLSTVPMVLRFTLILAFTLLLPTGVCDCYFRCC